ncbi:uncharacterized protein AKAME5_001468900 [Lates japonicus]|uniref:Uncharacterized protein n=1 Tax=Lates japonicus TaxID=270547 RepID=A0AAD3N0W6_LATJO|nr:uncharacterized protein AKAME5_001468900 [Lates japonicus]
MPTLRFKCMDIHPLFYGNTTISEVNSNNAPSGEPSALLLQSGCRDCLVIKEDVFISSFLLLSKENREMT